MAQEKMVFTIPVKTPDVELYYTGDILIRYKPRGYDRDIDGTLQNIRTILERQDTYHAPHGGIKSLAEFVEMSPW